MQENARKYFIMMVRDCGETIVRMQSSFEMYLNQYMQDFPDEKQLLLDAFKAGIPLKLIQHAGEPNYAEYLAKLGPRFVEVARCDPVDADWAVETWAMALNRTADYVAKPKQDRFYAEDHIDVAEEQQKQQVAYTAMTIIVTAGGFLGGALAAMAIPLVLVATTFNIGDGSGRSPIDSETDQILFFIILGVVGGGLCAAASFCGWWIGKGAENPWATFSVACGTSFTMVVIAAFIPFGFIFKAISIFGSVFGATYKSAARGGEY